MKALFMSVLIVVFVGAFGHSVFAGGITGGTSIDTTERQRQHTEKEVSSRHTDQGVSRNTQRAIDVGYKVVTEVFPVVGNAEKLLKVGKWAGEQQRKGGGVTATGSTVK